MDLQEITGIGEAVEARLNEAGIGSVEDLAEAEVSSVDGVSESKMEKLTRRARKETVILQSGEESKVEKESKNHISSGLDALDNVLDGGYRQGHIVGIAGEPSSGKTQLAFRALGAAVEQTGQKAVYIETERERFDIDRVAELSDLDAPEIEANVWRAKAYSLDQQLEAYRAVADNLDEVGLVVVDSFTARFRLEEDFEGRTGLTERNSAMVRHLNEMERMVDVLDCPALLTLQIQANPQRFGSNEVTWGGTLMGHTITYTLKMSQAEGSFRRAELTGHPSLPEDEILLAIGEEEIQAQED